MELDKKILEEGKLIEALVSKLPSSKLQFNKNEIIEVAGQLPKGIHKIRTGIIKVTLPLKNNHSIIDLVGSNTFLGLNLFLQAENIFSLVCLTDAEVTFIPKEIIVKHALDAKIDFTSYHFYHQLEHMKHKIKMETQMVVEDKVIHFLHTINRLQKNRWLKINRHDIANYANCSEEHVSRILSKFKQNGSIFNGGTRHESKSEVNFSVYSPYEKILRKKYEFRKTFDPYLRRRF